jgi:uncharacterized protein YndB with AHSA1/START domain
VDGPSDTDPTPDDATVVRRDVELDATPEAVWELIGDGARWSSWLVDDGSLVVEPGVTGAVVDAAELRTVRVDEVVEGRSVRFDWWPSEAPDRASTVTLVIDPSAGATVLRIVEVFPPVVQAPVAQASIAWEVRAVAAWLCCRTPAYV